MMFLDSSVTPIRQTWTDYRPNKMVHLAKLQRFGQFGSVTEVEREVVFHISVSGTYNVYVLLHSFFFLNIFNPTCFLLYVNWFLSCHGGIPYCVNKQS